MSKNKVYNHIDLLNLPVAEGTASGDPVVVGALAGVAETSRDTDGNALVHVNGGPVFSLSVKGVDGSGNAAIAVGDKVYLTAADTPKINVKTTGVAYGYALEAVASGATKTIKVLLAS